LDGFWKHSFANDSFYAFSLFFVPLTDLMTMELMGDLQQKYIEKEDKKKLKQKLKRRLCLNFFGRVKD
jgi:hypothetical protein